MTPASRLIVYFIEAMIPHHEGAIAMAKAAQSQGSAPEVQDLAGTIMRRAKEIVQMNTCESNLVEVTHQSDRGIKSSLSWYYTART